MIVNPIELIIGDAVAEPLSVSANGTYIAPTGMAYTPVTVNVSGGDTSVEDGIVTGTISQYQNNRVTSIAPWKFAFCNSLVTVSFPICLMIESNAFGSCNSLQTVNFPSCRVIRQNAFNICGSLTSINFPMCVSIANAAFGQCSKLTSVIFPSCESIASYVFSSCTLLQMASFPALLSISGFAFMSCHRLISLYLLGSSIPRLVFSYAFQSTPIDGYSAVAGRYGSIYVPASLLSSYQTATNWVYFSARFVGLTESEITALEATA